MEKLSSVDQMDQMDQMDQPVPPSSALATVPGKGLSVVEPKPNKDVLAPGDIARVCDDRRVKDILADKKGIVQATLYTNGELYHVKPTLTSVHKVQSALNEIIRVGERVLDRDIVPVGMTAHDYNSRFGNVLQATSIKVKGSGSKLKSEPQQFLVGLIEKAIAVGSTDIYITLLKAENKAVVSMKTHKEKHPFPEFNVEHEFGTKVVKALWTLDEKQNWEPAGVRDVGVTYTYQQDRNRTVKYRLRGSSLEMPGVGHSVCIRLRNATDIIPLEDMTYTPKQFDAINQIKEAKGLAVIAGETGSGKSTTLTAIMSDIPSTKHVMEIANPVEIYMEGITQVDTNSFEGDDDLLAKVYAATTRQEPDVLVLGEINNQDGREAKAIDALSSSGKRVWTTTHTSAAAYVPDRLIELGVNSKFLGQRMTFAGAIAQTLIPVVCPKCALKKHPDKTVDKRFKELFGGNLRFRNKNSSGCTCTNGLEKRSQVVAEVYPLCAAKDKAYQLIRDGKYDDLAAYMENEEGVESMRQIAADRVRRGIFDPEIVIERIGFFDPKGSWRKNNA